MEISRYLHTTSIGHVNTQNTIVSAHYIDVDTLSHVRGDRCGDWCGTTFTLIHLHHKAIRILLSVLSFLLLNTEYKFLYPPNFMFHLIIINRNQSTMAHTKQTPRNPHIDKPTAAIGSDVQPE